MTSLAGLLVAVLAGAGTGAIADGSAPAEGGPALVRSFLSLRLIAPTVLTADGSATGSAWYGGVSISGVAHRTLPSRVLLDLSERFQGGFGSPGALAAFDAAFDVGYLLPVTTDAGPFAAAGAQLSLLTMPSAGWRAAEIPRAALGFHADGRGIGVHAFGYVGWLLGSGSIEPDAHGTTSRPDVGGRLFVYQIASTTGDYLVVDGRHLIDPPANPGIPADQVSASACFPRLWRLQACLSGSLMQSMIRTDTAPAVRSRWRLLSLEIAFDNAASRT
jgi:hypothetical protein